MELFFELLLAVLAVFGLWCLIRLLAQELWASRCIGIVIELSDRETARRLPDLLEEARHAPFGRRRAPLVVVYGTELCRAYGEPGASERALIAYYGGTWCIRREEDDA